MTAITMKTAFICASDVRFRCIIRYLRHHRPESDCLTRRKPERFYWCGLLFLGRLGRLLHHSRDCLRSGIAEDLCGRTLSSFDNGRIKWGTKFNFRSIPSGEVRERALSASSLASPRTNTISSGKPAASSSNGSESRPLGLATIRLNESASQGSREKEEMIL